MLRLKPHNKLKILNDPIYGFITIPSEDVYNLIEHPYFQRLRRITQMGLSYLVYPGAHHTRFHHAIGCMHLMQKAVQVLRSKQVAISDLEEDALYKAILLHDIGHGPFSHAMEHSITKSVHHEDVSLAFMETLNDVFNGSLTLAIQIFKGAYHRPFMLQLVSGQLDMDRLDYLKRDSFYTGVAEGNINSQRLISMLNVVENELVIEEKGIYSIEHFLTSRRLMYWQVYLHKTGIGAEHLLQSVLKRIRELVQLQVPVMMPVNLSYFINNNVRLNELDAATLNIFASLDDTDIVSTLKSGMLHDDFVLRELCTMILNRRLLKIKFIENPVSKDKMMNQKQRLMDTYLITVQEAGYFVFKGSVANTPYSINEPLKILTKSGKVIHVTDTGAPSSFESLTQKEIKHYYCYPKM